MTKRPTPAELLESARRILETGRTTFTVKPWREIMNSQTIVSVPPGTPVTVTPGDQPALIVTEHRFPKKEPYMGPERRGQGRTANGLRIGASVFDQVAGSGVDSPPASVVESGYGVDAGTTEPSGETNVEAQTQAQAPVNDIAAAQAAKEAAVQAKIAAKEKANADKAAAKAAKDAERAAAKAQKEAEKAARPPRVRTYEGSMTVLADRVKNGTYVKGANGQLRSNDEVAVALESIPAKRMVAFLLQVLGLEANPYAALNYGQQSMNLRNKLRGALKKPAVEGVEKLTLDKVKALRDEGGWTAEAPQAAADAPAQTQAPEASEQARGQAAEAAEQAEAGQQASPPSDVPARRRGKK